MSRSALFPLLFFPAFLFSCTIVLEGGAIHRDLALKGEVEPRCFSLDTITLLGANPFLEEAARDLWLKLLRNEEGRGCAGKEGIRVSIRNLAAYTSVSAYGFPPANAPDTLPPPSTVRVVLTGEFWLEPCTRKGVQGERLPFAAEGWIPFESDPFRGEERSLVALRELVEAKGAELRTHLARLRCTLPEGKSP